MTSHTIKIDGLNMVYTIDGENTAPPLILIHGWGSFKGVWRTTIPTLKAHFRCIAVDLIGFGDSAIPKNVDLTIPAQAQRIVTLIDALGYDRVTLMGHSMGGQIVLYLASQLIPDRVEKAVNVAGCCSAVLTPAAERDLWAAKLARWLPLYFALGRLWCHTGFHARMYCSHWFHDMDSVSLDFWRNDRYRTIQPHAERSLYPAWKAITSCDLTAPLSQITASTMTIFGKQDDVVPIEAGRIADEHIPDHRMVWIDNCGHFPMYEKTDRYLEVVNDFLL